MNQPTALQKAACKENGHEGSERHLVFHLDTVAGIGTLFEMESAAGHDEAAYARSCMEKLRPLLLSRLDCSNEDLIGNRE